MNTEPLLFNVLDATASEKLGRMQFNIDELRLQHYEASIAFETEKFNQYTGRQSQNQKIEFAMDGDRGILYLTEKA